MTDPAERPALAYHHTAGEGPCVVFLPGYASDMTGAKALALEAWAKASGRAFLRFDYAGCGASEGVFEEQSLVDWRNDAFELIDALLEGPAVLVGSSMGGWIALMLARFAPARVAAIVGVAPAPDFTDWGFTQDEKMTLLQHGRLEKASPYSDQPTVYSRRMWQSGEAHRMLHADIAFDGPVRIVQGQADPDVPWHHATHLAGRLRSADVQVWLIKDGDHRLSRDTDIALITRAVEDVIARL